jgi:hypothetical protein
MTFFVAFHEPSFKLDSGHFDDIAQAAVGYSDYMEL